jgi:hypothetical protein
VPFAMQLIRLYLRRGEAPELWIMAAILSPCRSRSTKLASPSALIRTSSDLLRTKYPRRPPAEAFRSVRRRNADGAIL